MYLVASRVNCGNKYSRNVRVRMY